MKNLTTTTAQTIAGNQKCVTFEISGRQFTLTQYDNRSDISVFSRTFNKSLNKWNGENHPHTGYKRFENLQDMMQHYKKFDEEILGLFI